MNKNNIYLDLKNFAHENDFFKDLLQKAIEAKLFDAEGNATFNFMPLEQLAEKYYDNLQSTKKDNLEKQQSIIGDIYISIDYSPFFSTQSFSKTLNTQIIAHDNIISYTCHHSNSSMQIVLRITFPYEAKLITLHNLSSFTNDTYSTLEEECAIQKWIFNLLKPYEQQIISVSIANSNPKKIKTKIKKISGPSLG